MDDGEQKYPNRDHEEEVKVTFTTIRSEREARESEIDVRICV